MLDIITNIEAILFVAVYIVVSTFPIWAPVVFGVWFAMKVLNIISDLANRGY